MAYQAKKEMDVVTEQPGTKQQVMVEGKKEKEPKKFDKAKAELSYSEKGESRFRHKENTQNRTKNESAEYHSTGMEHPSVQYESYKRPRRDS